MERAVITHAHLDHARLGCGSYLGTPECVRLLRVRFGSEVKVRDTHDGAPIELKGIRLASQYPTGHRPHLFASQHVSSVQPQHAAGHEGRIAKDEEDRLYDVIHAADAAQ